MLLPIRSSSTHVTVILSEMEIHQAAELAVQEPRDMSPLSLTQFQVK